MGRFFRLGGVIMSNCEDEMGKNVLVDKGRRVTLTDVLEAFRSNLLERPRARERVASLERPRDENDN